MSDKNWKDDEAVLSTTVLRDAEGNVTFVGKDIQRSLDELISEDDADGDEGEILGIATGEFYKEPEA